LPDAFKDFTTKQAGKKLNREFFTHCHREFAHEQWRILLNDEFLDAYENGIVVECPDGITRRFYPRIFTYSADYPEK
jgi:ribulose kinase